MAGRHRLSVEVLARGSSYKLYFRVGFVVLNIR